MTYDYIIIGAGIIGLSTARQLQQSQPGCSVLILEKEAGPAHHQTGHNSGVIHAGVYYQPGSLKARFCREGNIATRAFCDEHGVTYDQCGKLLVATDDLELQRMQELIERCAENEIAIEVLDEAQLKKREPNISGVGAVLVPSTGIVSYIEISEKMAKLVEANQGEIRYNNEVLGLAETSEQVIIRTTQGKVKGRFLVACAGLMADRVVSMLGIQPEFKIIPFRGDYYQLPEKHNQIVKHLIYPIPDPNMPFLGVHLTRMIDGSVTVGPNAVMAFKREGYRKIDFSLRDSFEALTYPGLLRVLWANFKISMVELKNGLYKKGYLELVRKYCPKLQVDDLQPYPSGVRAQAVTKQGELVHDFLFIDTPRTLSVCNAPSPAATSAIPIGKYIVVKVKQLTEQLPHI